MSTVIVRYRVKEGRGDDNVGLVRAVFAQLERERAPGLAYQTYRAEAGVGSTHRAQSEKATTPDGRHMKKREETRPGVGRARVHTPGV